MIMYSSASNKTSSTWSPVTDHVPWHIDILHTLVTTNPGRESKLLYSLIKILKHSARFVVCTTLQIHHGSAVLIDAPMHDKSPGDEFMVWINVPQIVCSFFDRLHTEVSQLYQDHLCSSSFLGFWTVEHGHLYLWDCLLHRFPHYTESSPESAVSARLIRHL